MKPFYFLAIVVVVALVSIIGCAPAPAAFEVVSLDITPAEVTAGGAVTVTTQVKNVGGSKGVYAAMLTVDGAKVETKDITVAAGAIEKQTFSLTKDKAGTYSVSVGGQNSTFVVKPKLVVKEVELKYDDGEARDYISSCGGYLIDYLAPSESFAINKVRMMGVIPENQTKDTFDVEILDTNMKLLYVATFPVTKFGKTSTLVDVDIPNIKVAKKFYVHVYTGTCRRQGIHLGADDSVKNEHSDVTARTLEGIKIVDWTYLYPSNQWYGNKSQVNWLIRIIGTYSEP